jgi:hypothetical protein
MKFILLPLLYFFTFPTANQNKAIPIVFKDMEVEVLDVPKLGDTLIYKSNSKETFKFVFFDTRGKSYCERYMDGKLYQKGNYENSLDTLSRYISRRGLDGKHSPIIVQKYFQPLRNGQWITYKGKKIIEERYLMGHLQKAFKCNR